MKFSTQSIRLKTNHNFSFLTYEQQERSNYREKAFTGNTVPDQMGHRAGGRITRPMKVDDDVIQFKWQGKYQGPPGNECVGKKYLALEIVLSWQGSHDVVPIRWYF